MWDESTKQLLFEMPFPLVYMLSVKREQKNLGIWPSNTYVFFIYFVSPNDEKGINMKRIE